MMKRIVRLLASSALCLALVPAPAFALAGADGDAARGEAPVAAAHDGSTEDVPDGFMTAFAQVAAPTKDQIKSKYQSLSIDLYGGISYLSESKATAPYALGSLSPAYLDNALNLLNLIRYVAGVPSDVALDSEYNEYAQAAALVNEAMGIEMGGGLYLSHTPDRPSGMDDGLYELGYAGASHSNIAAGYSNLAGSILGWMDDSDAGNISRLGHRRWCLDPNMRFTGFGQVGRSSAMYTMDNVSLDVPYELVAWPATNMPTSLFGDSQAWSASLDFGPYGGDITNVTVVRKSDGRTWNLHSGSADGYFVTSVNSMGGYIGSGSCVIFRPSGISYSAGDSFEVTLVGANGRSIGYTVDFFDMEPKSMHRLYNPNSGEHFYTASEGERDVLVRSGWSYEGIGWKAPSSSNTPVFRLYSGTDHHYTTNPGERDALVRAGWSYEGIGWYSDDAQGVPLYRQFNPHVNPAAARNNSGSHNYTTSKSENDALVVAGWREEGIGWYGCK